MRRLWAHVRELWPRWTLLPALPFLGWGVFWILHGGFRWDHLLMMTVLPGLAYATPKTKRFFVGMYPVFLVGLVYDSLRFFRHWGVTASRIHVCDLWELEKALFGITVGGVRMSVTDWLQQHPKLWLDLPCAIPYGTYFFIVLAYSAYLYFRDYRQMMRFGWAFLLMSLLAFVTQHIYPAAPPWYLHKFGCVVDLQASASAGPALLRVDAWTGLRFFQGLYGRTAEVFGAMPSLHVAYPLLTTLAAWRYHGWPMRTFLVCYSLMMGFAALYLDHHWVVDIVAGCACALLAKVVVWRLIRDPAKAAAKTADLGQA